MQENEIIMKQDYEYFCNKKGEDLANAISGKVSDYDKFLVDEGLLNALRTSARYYYNKEASGEGIGYDTSTASFNFKTKLHTGSTYKRISVNKYGPNIDKMMQLTTSQKTKL